MDKNKEEIIKKKVKVVFLGDKGVGKSSVIQRFASDKFQQNTQVSKTLLKATIGVDFMTKVCKFNNHKYKLQLWDTAGQQKYRSLIKGYLRGANACIFVYDCSNLNTYLNLVQWIKTFEQIDSQEATFGIIFGNKNDLLMENNNLQKVRAQIKNLHPKIRDYLHIEGSAKESHNIKQIFEQILQYIQQNSSQKRIQFNSNKSIGHTLIQNFKKNAPLSFKNAQCCKF